MKKSTKQKLPRAPAALSEEGKAWWRKIVGEYELDDAGFLILQTALECLDTMREAQTMIKADGMVLTDRFGQRKAHPAVLIERDAKVGMLRAFKALNLEIESIAIPTGRWK